MRTIDILICTFRRPEVTQTLTSLANLKVPSDTTLRVVVADNDESPSAAARVQSAALPFPIHYVHAPACNISIARNACLDAADGHWVAFLDDDETADPDWLAHLLATAEQTGCDGVFGPSIAIYEPDVPGWMRRQDHHSNIPVRRGGVVETGHTCNALLRWRDADWRDERFDIARGRSGGEDTEFFSRLYRMGARFEISDSAIVREPVAPDRLSFRWLRRRKYRMGQSYASAASTRPARIRLGLSALGKAAFCILVAGVNLPSEDRRNFWALRAALHVGVVSGCLSLHQAELYGFATDPSNK